MSQVWLTVITGCRVCVLKVWNHRDDEYNMYFSLVTHTQCQLGVKPVGFKSRNEHFSSLFRWFSGRTASPSELYTSLISRYTKWILYQVAAVLVRLPVIPKTLRKTVQRGWHEQSTCAATAVSQTYPLVWHEPSVPGTGCVVDLCRSQVYEG